MALLSIHCMGRMALSRKLMPDSWAGNIEGAGNDNRGDPSVAVGLDGRWYAGKIDGNFGQSVAWSTDQGTTWHDVVVATVPTPGQDILDKDDLCIDNSPASPFKGRLYDAWTSFVAIIGLSPGRIITLNDNGLTWSPSVEISTAGTCRNILPWGKPSNRPTG